ncbi:MAG: GMC family oxidoreductase, partial [Candidatus Dadabacteria bacterium]
IMLFKMDGEKNRYKMIVVGTGLASTFFLMRSFKGDGSVLVIERGKRDTHSWRVANRRHMQKHGVVSSVDYESTFINLNRHKEWVYTPAFGGSSNCWWGHTPRFHPSDFKLNSLYGVGRDWPVSYDDLEKYYCEAERVMQVAGEMSDLFPRSQPFPLKPHTLNRVDQLMRKANPSMYIPLPCARPSKELPHRHRCCASGVCYLCPVDAKFTVLNELAWIYERDGIELMLESEALALDIEGGKAKGVVVRHGGEIKRIKGDIIVLGANAIFNPAILLRSGDRSPGLGEGLSEQLSIGCRVMLDGVRNFQGSTSHTAHGYMLYDGAHRKERGAVLIESSNIPLLRLEKGRYREAANFKFIIEDLPSPKNRIEVKGWEKPKLIFEGHSNYALSSLQYVKETAHRVFAPLPVERIKFSEKPLKTESHILGTTPMGVDRDNSVVDPNLVHHRYRNVLVLGGSVFPTITPSNPSLTICALSLMAADRIGGV